MCIFIRKCTFFNRFNAKNYEKKEKYVILITVKELLFHDKKTGSTLIYKTKCTIC